MPSVAKSIYSSLEAHARAPPNLDVDQLFAKLDNLENARRERESLTPRLADDEYEEEWLNVKEHEIQCYHELVNLGGRPPFVLETFDSICKNPKEYIEAMRPWLDDVLEHLLEDDLADDWGRSPEGPVAELRPFSLPLLRWREFRRWQLINRGFAEDLSLADFIEKMLHEGFGGLIHERQVVDERSEELWLRDRDRIREVRDGTFDEYAQAVQRRLRDHGFSEAFQLLEDPRLQDERVTWIEYLDFEYWWLDKRTALVPPYQARRDAAWEKLVESGVLKDGETEEVLLTDKYLKEPKIPEKPLRYKLINEFLYNTRPYRAVKSCESHQLLRVQWALSQMPENQPEVTPAKPARKGRKRRRQEDDDDQATANKPMEQSATKRQKQAEGGAPQRKTKPRNVRMTVGLDIPVASPRFTNEDGHRRSARNRASAAR